MQSSRVTKTSLIFLQYLYNCSASVVLLYRRLQPERILFLDCPTLLKTNAIPKCHQDVSYLCAILYLYCSASVVLLYRRLQPQYDHSQGQPQQSGFEGKRVITNFHFCTISQHLRHILAFAQKNSQTF